MKAVKVQKKKVKNHKSFLTIIIIVAILVIAVFIVNNIFKVKTITVEGSNYYTQEEITSMVLENTPANTVFLYLKNNYGADYIIPFIEKIDIEILSKNDIRINVYEKSITGSIEYMSEYLYFDKDGIIVESSTQKIDNIPCVTGLIYERIILYEKLQITEEENFNFILNLTQLIKKYDLNVDKVKFNIKNEIILISGEIKILFGLDRFFDERVANLKTILSSLEGMRGELDMKVYNSSKDDVIFKKEK